MRLTLRTVLALTSTACWWVGDVWLEAGNAAHRAGRGLR